jgi:1,4-alpha-glucan branching enzyme
MQQQIALIITAHVPYLRSSGRQPEGEDLLHETMLFGLVPLLTTLTELRAAGHLQRIGLVCSPILLEQLADPVVQKHAVRWMQDWLIQAEHSPPVQPALRTSELTYLTRFYVDFGTQILDQFNTVFRRDLTAVIRDLQSAGMIELLLSPATHPYLPSLPTDWSLTTQLQLGQHTLRHHFGQTPTGLWLPELGFQNRLLAPIAHLPVQYFTTDLSSWAFQSKTTTLKLRSIPAHSLTTITTTTTLSRLLWSTDLGYPGDPLYRAPDRDAETGLALWRNGQHHLAAYDPYYAFRRAREHAQHFRDTAVSLATSAAERTTLLIVPIDLELLGRRWFEGPIWLRALLELLLDDPQLELTTPDAYLAGHPPLHDGTLTDGSWGLNGDHQTWNGPHSRTIRSELLIAEEHMLRLAHRVTHQSESQQRLLCQAARSLLLAQSSDWLLLAGQPAFAEYATGRVRQHLSHVFSLCAACERTTTTLNNEDLALLEEIEERDHAFTWATWNLLFPIE